MTITAYEARKIAGSTQEAHNKRIAPLYAQIRAAATEGKRQITTTGIPKRSGMHGGSNEYTGDQADNIVAELKSAGFRVSQNSKKETMRGDDEQRYFYYYIITW